jgi:hypothetical protein
MNFYAIRAIYIFEMSRTWRTLMESIASPILTTSLYFIVFGAAIGSRMGEIDGIEYAAFIIPGLLMLSLLGESISNAAGITAGSRYRLRWRGCLKIDGHRSTYSYYCAFVCRLRGFTPILDVWLFAAYRNHLQPVRFYHWSVGG